MGIVKHTRYFLEKTSMKGVPRIFKVLSFVTSCAYHVHSSLRCYLSYPVVFTLNEEILFHSSPTEIPLPSIILCNLNPFNSNLQKATAVQFLRSYGKRFKALIGCHNCSNQQELITLYKKEFYSPASLFQFGNEDEIESVAIQRENFILDCHMYTFHVSELKLTPCESNVTISKLVTPEMLNCYTLTLPHSSYKVPVTGLSLIIYLDNLSTQPHSFFTYNPLNDHSEEGGK